MEVAMLPIRFSSMPTDEARAYQAGAADANGQTPERHISDGDGVPCRHCQRDVAAGEPYLILAYRPFPELQPYAEVGPIFLHAEPCERYPSTDEAPPMFMKPGRRYLLKGYRASDRIFYGTGEIVEPHDVTAAAARILARPDVAYVHVRSALNNCFQCRIDRA
jgi:hypothetical protein